MSTRYNNDLWTLEDDLGIAGAGDHVARMVLETPPPFTLGISGKWGSGKTSVMRRTFATLKGKPVSQALPIHADREENGSDANRKRWKELAFDHQDRRPPLDWSDDLKKIANQCLPIWYSPWQHQNEANPIIPLLLEIKNQFTTWMKLKDKLDKVNRRGGLAGIALLERVTDAALGLYLGKSVKLASDTSQAVRKAWREAEPEVTGISDGQRFHLLFEDAIETLLDGIISNGEQEAQLTSEARLIIFIDDLDRCEEQQAVRLLECIKLYLGTKRCVFVLGMDYAAIQGALNRFWAERSQDDNREYLEKLFQATLPLPLPAEKQIQKLAKAQLNAHGFPEATTCAKDIERLLEPNPRKIKNFLNSLCAASELFPKLKEDLEIARRFIMFHYLRLNHPPIWRLLERQRWALKFLHRVLNSSTEIIKGLPDHVDENQQRILRELFSRAFCHVLEDDAPEEGGQPMHRRFPLEQAVELFHERVDRKRSDDYFKRMFSQLYPEPTDLDECFLHLQ